MSKNEYDSVQDSGERREFSTGSVRDTRTGKGRYDLISPIGLRRLAVHYENGAVKYGDRNWEKGQPLMSYLDSALRHLNTYIAGDRSEDHLAASAWNVFSFMHTQEKIEAGELPAELDDVPKAQDFEAAVVRTFKKALDEQAKKILGMTHIGGVDPGEVSFGVDVDCPMPKVKKLRVERTPGYEKGHLYDLYAAAFPNAKIRKATHVEYTPWIMEHTPWIKDAVIKGGRIASQDGKLTLCTDPEIFDKIADGAIRIEATASGKPSVTLVVCDTQKKAEELSEKLDPKEPEKIKTGFDHDEVFKSDGMAAMCLLGILKAHAASGEHLWWFPDSFDRVYQSGRADFLLQGSKLRQPYELCWEEISNCARKNLSRLLQGHYESGHIICLPEDIYASTFTVVGTSIIAMDKVVRSYRLQPVTGDQELHWKIVFDIKEDLD